MAQFASGSKIAKDMVLTVAILTAPVMFMHFSLDPNSGPQSGALFTVAEKAEQLSPIKTWLLFATAIVLLAMLEFVFGLYGRHQTAKQRAWDFLSFVIDPIFVIPLAALIRVRFFPTLLPQMNGQFSWIPLGWAIAIVLIYDDLVHYWYHRLHHELSWLWRFHRFHHEVPYMGVLVASRIHIVYRIGYSPYLSAALFFYLGMGKAAILVFPMKAIVALLAHSSLAWDKPLYRHRILRPIAWILERSISTPATHHAHHGLSMGEGRGNVLNANYGSLFFIWDLIFDTAVITRNFPKSYGLPVQNE